MFKRPQYLSNMNSIVRKYLTQIIYKTLIIYTKNDKVCIKNEYI